jgi:hypothetical protein
VANRSNLSHVAARGLKLYTLRERKRRGGGGRCSEEGADIVMCSGGFIPERKKDSAGKDGVQYAFDPGRNSGISMEYIECECCYCGWDIRIEQTSKTLDWGGVA